MIGRLSGKLLTVLQLTRMALVFTAIADALCTLLLAHRGQHPPFVAMLLMAGVSVGLYGFGMSLNDIIDRRRDQLLAATRPLPSGRLNVTTAHLICGLLGSGAIACGAIYSFYFGTWLNFLMVLWTAALIVFYDSAGKYLVWPGLITLGLIRFFHAAIPAPNLPLIWHPLVLLNHVALLSTLAYMWEQKRPILTRAHVMLVILGLFVINLLVIVAVGQRRAPRAGGWLNGLEIQTELMIPLAAALIFAGIAFYIRRSAPTERDAGQRLMLYGLLWLIVYDAAFVAAYVDWSSGLLVLLLMPLAYGSVQLMRWWSRLAAIAQRPAYRRA